MIKYMLSQWMTVTDRWVCGWEGGSMNWALMEHRVPGRGQRWFEYWFLIYGTLHIDFSDVRLMYLTGNFYMAV